MKRLLLPPVLALALVACSESPTAPLADPGAPLFDRLESSGLAFADNGATTGCTEEWPTSWTCTYDITSDVPRTIYVSTTVTFAWTYQCVTQNARTSTSGVVLDRIKISDVFTGARVTGSFTHATAQPSHNPCSRRGNPALIWIPTVRSWEVYADDDNDWANVYICKSSDGACD